jgi:hypothetical protein
MDVSDSVNATGYPMDIGGNGILQEKIDQKPEDIFATEEEIADFSEEDYQAVLKLLSSEDPEDDQILSHDCSASERHEVVHSMQEAHLGAVDGDDSARLDVNSKASFQVSAHADAGVVAFEGTAATFHLLEEVVVAGPNGSTLQDTHQKEPSGIAASVNAPVEEFKPLNPALQWQDSVKAKTIAAPSVRGETFPRPQDVIKGRGGKANVQNVILMRLIKAYRRYYEAARRANDNGLKVKIGAAIVDEVLRCGGRFLQLQQDPATDSCEWIEMSKKHAVAKAMATMRDEISRYPTPRAP